MPDAAAWKCKEAATQLLLFGLQSWGQSGAERRRAWQDALTAAGVLATVEGESEPFTFAGVDASKAAALYADISRNWFQGKFELEEAWIAARLQKNS